MSKANVNELEDEFDIRRSLIPGQLAVPSKAMEAMKAGVSPQENDVRKIRKYIDGKSTKAIQEEEFALFLEKGEN